MRKCIYNAIVVGTDSLMPNHAVFINGDRIASILPTNGFNLAVSEDMHYIDACGGYVMPGFIDIHSDYIEGIIHPRPTCIMEFDTGLREAEKQLLAHGVTTIFHSLSLMNRSTSERAAIRTQENVEKLVALIKNHHDGYHLIRHRFHARYEIDNVSIYDYLSELLDSGVVNMLSFMDHTPGQGQYRDLEVFVKSYPNLKTGNKDQFMKEILENAKNKPVASHEMLKKLAALAHEKKIPLASHDDDTLEKLHLMKNEFGIKISEFPIELEVAKKASDEGILVVVGAPNVMLGGSHSGNLSAVDAIRAGAAHILCSDYYPASLLHSAFRLEEEGVLSLPAAVQMLTKNPARAMDIDADYGSIEAGKKADLLMVKKIHGKPMVQKCFIDGQTVLQFDYRSGEGDNCAAS